ncbi:MAG: DNA polymerase III subunit gamma/tau [Pseudomonadota bacterium]
MSYQVLARKWRPGRFADMVGQTHVLRALTNALDNDRVHHAFLFTGTRGVGKTTIARILAKSLNCERGVSAQPCGECGTCVEVDEGRFIDLIEVDAASRARVDETRELLDNVQYAPARGRYKIYLIDEVHMFSRHSFNALLKTLEEPPPHVKFLLATTDPQRVPVTILSRCLQFNLRRLSVTDIEGQLATIVEAEQMAAEPGALRLLAVAADGSMRDGLSLLDQAIAFGGGALKELDVQSLLGGVDRRRVIELLSHIVNQDSRGALALARDFAEQGADFGELLAEVIAALSRIAVLMAVPDLEDEADADADALAAIASALAPETAQLLYQIALHGRHDLPLAPDPRAGFDMIVLRMLAFSPLAPPENASVPRANVTERPPRRPEPAPSENAPTPAPTPKAASKTAPKSRVAPSPEPQPDVIESTASPRAKDADGPEAAPITVAGASRNELSERPWDEILRELKLVGLSAEVAANTALCPFDGEVVRLQISPTFAPMLVNDVRDRLVNALHARYDQVAVRIDVQEPDGDTPAMIRARQNAESQSKAAEAIANDPNVQAILDRFDARVEPGSVKSGQS